MSSKFKTDYGGLGSATKMMLQYCYVRELENKGPGSNQDLAAACPQSTAVWLSLRPMRSLAHFYAVCWAIIGQQCLFKPSQ